MRTILTEVRVRFFDRKGLQKGEYKMAKSSINFQKAKAHSFAHNFRKDKPNYLLPKEFQKSNEFWKHEKSEKEIFDDELSRAKRKGGRVPKLENSRWEALLNLNSIHNLEDVKKVAKHIEKKFNITCTAISIHRDEGHIENDKPQYNFHSHLNFLTYKDGRQNWRREHIQPKNLTELQTEIAKLLGMERGKFNSKAKRLEHSQYKAVVKEKAKQKDLKNEVTKLREQLKEQGATRKDYAKLEQFVKELKEQIKNKNLSIENLHKKISAYKEEFSNLESLANAELSSARSIIDKLKKENSELKKKNTELEKTVNKYAKYIYDSQAAAAASPAEANQIKSKTYQQKIFYEVYKSEIDDILKNFYISRSGNLTKFSNKKKKIEVIDKGDVIESNSENLKESVKLMLDIAVAKKWKIEDIKLQGTPEFKEEARLQIAARIEKNRLNGLQATKKVEEVQNPVKVEKVTQNEDMTPENEDFTDENEIEYKKIIARYRELSKFPNFEELQKNVPEVFEKCKNPHFENVYEISRRHLKKETQDIQNLDYGLAR